MTSHVVCRDCTFEAVTGDRFADDTVETHEEETGHEVVSEQVDGTTRMATDGGQPTLLLTEEGLEIPDDVDLSKGAVFRARGVTVDHKPGSEDLPFYPALEQRHLEADEISVQNDNLDEDEVSVKQYGHDAKTYQVVTPKTDGGRDYALPGDDLWQRLEESGIGIGDVVVDLARGKSLQVVSVATHTAGEHERTRSDRTAEMFGADTDELVFNCVFLPNQEDDITPPSKTYAYPESRLLRYPVEEATPNARLQREWLSNVLEQLAVVTTKFDDDRQRQGVFRAVDEAFGEDVVETLEEFAAVAGGEQ